MKILGQIFRLLIYLTTAVSLLGLVNNVFPALINLSELLEIFIRISAKIRNVFLLPITYLLRITINIEMYEWLKTYLFLGFLFWNSYNAAHIAICGMPSPLSALSLIWGESRLKQLLLILWSILLWPMSVLDLIKHYNQGKFENKQNVYTYWGYRILFIWGITFLIAFLNFSYIKISKQIEEYNRTTELVNTKKVVVKTKNESKILAYLDKTIIIDSTLYLENYYSRLVFGGVNFNLVKCKGMTIKGEVIEERIESKNEVSFPIFDKPIIEFLYKEIYYEIKIERKTGQFYYQINEIDEPRLQIE